MRSPQDYSDNFFEYHLKGALKSAEAIVPVVLNYVQPQSVIDVGCGIGAWLNIWKKFGVIDIFGIDGNYVDSQKLLINKDCFLPINLEERFALTKKYDLVTCLEVAEHLHEGVARHFIESLCSLGDIILFSAAIPGQGGTLHYNEQYPDYWIALFKESGFIPVDCLRNQLWDKHEISWWYRQNIMFFIKDTAITNFPALKDALTIQNEKVLNLVHPELFEHFSTRPDQINLAPIEDIEVQIFWAKANQQFEEQSSIRLNTRLQETPTDMSFIIGDNINAIDFLRFDIGHKIGFINIHGITIKNNRDDLIWEWDKQTFTSRNCA